MGAWFERRLREPSFVIPEIADFRRQRTDARTAIGRHSEAERAEGGRPRDEASEREGAFGNAVITAEVRYFLVTKHYLTGSHRRLGGPDGVGAVPAVDHRHERPVRAGGRFHLDAGSPESF